MITHLLANPMYTTLLNQALGHRLWNNVYFATFLDCRKPVHAKRILANTSGTNSSFIIPEIVAFPLTLGSTINSVPLVLA